MPLFRWFSVGPIPTTYDLRRIGWQLLTDQNLRARAKRSSICGRARHLLPGAGWGCTRANCAAVAAGRNPGEGVDAAELLFGVWRLSFRPETNSLAVRVSRLRGKLRTAGVDGLVETLPDGAYRLIPAEPRRALPLERDLGLDGYLRLREEPVTA